MNTLTAQTMLQAWEHVQSEHPVRRSLALLRTAWPEAEAGRWGALPVGVRDRWLITLREGLFGKELDTVVDCPACGEVLEIRFTTDSLLRSRTGSPAGEDAESAAARTLPPLLCDGWEIEFRLPCSDDLLAVTEDEGGRDALLARLIERCVIAACRGDERV